MDNKDLHNRLLTVKDLHVSFGTYGGEVQAVRGVNFYVNKGETLGIVGESGCGKSVTAKSVMRMIPMPPGKIKSGEVFFDNKEIMQCSEKCMEKIRGKDMSMIFQDPMTSLNPTMKIGKQIMEGYLTHNKVKKKEAKERVLEMLKLVGIPNIEKRIDQYPHEFSGGMKQRAMIALAMISNPKLLIADEPTTALDVTIQAQILELMQDIQNKFNTSIIMITHDLGVVANMAHRIVVMYAGKIIESGTTDDIFYNAQHPYTWGLLKSVPRLDIKKENRLNSIEGLPPDLFNPPKGCPFAARCDYAMRICKEAYPETTKISENHFVNCWLKHDMAPTVNANITERGGSVNG